MYEREKQRSIHLMILFYNTIFIVSLSIGAIYLKLEMWAVMMFFVGLIASWLLHITEKVSASIRLWLYIILAMLAFSFFAVYEMGLFDLASAMMILILICTTTEERVFVRLCAVTYYLTIFYKMSVTYENLLKIPTDTMIRIFFHFALIFAGERLAETILQRRRKERRNSDEKISRLEDANRRAEDFLANVSHELRTPINAVTGLTTVMMKNEEDPGKKKDILSIQMAGNRLFNQIEDILDYTETDAGRVIVSEENYTVFSLVNDIIVGNRMVKRDKELELIFDIDAGIPSVLYGDGRKIRKILKHLIDNAVKFTKKGGVYVRVYAIHKPYGINLCIRVSDTGAGIAEEELEKITEKFFQSNGGRNRKTGGLGLGLPIVYGMVTAMEGFIQIESGEGNGTTVSVSIPQKVVDAAPSMEVPNRAELCIGLYLRQEKYEIPEVRDYYNTAISHMVWEMDLAVHRVFEMEELKKLTAMYRLTHLVIGGEEYEESISYFESLAQGIEVIVVADDRFQPAADSRVKFVRKPFYGLPIINILNFQAPSDIDRSEKENMICPGVRVLVVDDEPMNLMVAEGIFTDYQMAVKTAGSGMEAVEICEREEFDLIFLDHMMPEMDGVQTLKLLRRLQADTGRTNTVIAFTANAVSGAREMFLQEGFDEFISKPIEEQELKRLLRKVLPQTAIAYVVKTDREKPSVKEEEEKQEQTAAFPQNDRKDRLACLKERGFHTESGMIYCRSDREYYEKLLILFAKNADTKIAEIETSFQKEDMKDYEIRVHALKSSSKMIGADMLSGMAKHAEEAAKSRDVAYIRENHGELIGKYRETVQDILDVLSPGEPSPPGEDFADGAEVSGDELVVHMSELRKSLDIFDANMAETLLEKMGGLVYQGKAVNELLGGVRQDVENFELVAASEKVEALIHSMEGGEAL